MENAQRTARFPAPALKALLEMQPFARSAWDAATSETLHVRIGNSPTLTTKSDSLDALGAFLMSTDAFGRGFCEVWAVKEAIYIETELECRAAILVIEHIPCSVVARTTHGLVQDLRFYLDPSPLS